MSIEWLQKFCMALPHTTQQVQWEDALVFKVGGKMYAVARLEPGDHWLSLKCGDEEFVELIEKLPKKTREALATPKRAPNRNSKITAVRASEPQPRRKRISCRKPSAKNR